MTEDGKGGDPVYISHLVIATMLKGINGELIQRETTFESDKGTRRTVVYGARLGIPCCPKGRHRSR